MKEIYFRLFEANHEIRIIKTFDSVQNKAISPPNSSSFLIGAAIYFVEYIRKDLQLLSCLIETYIYNRNSID